MFGKSKLVILAVVLAACVLISSVAYAEVRLRVAGNFPVEHSASRAMQLFKEKVEERSGGQIRVDLFPAMQLGGPTENVDQVRSGLIFGVWTSIAYFSRTVPEYEAVSLPFLFDNHQQAYKVMDGEVSKIFDAKMSNLGFVNLGYGELGFRHVTNNLRPITSVGDFRGMRIRLQPNEVHLATFRALGANPQSMDVSELYSALQQGVLDAQENPYNIIASRRFNEVQKHLSDTGHFFDFINFVANKRLYDRLSEAHRKIIDEAATEAVIWQRKVTQAEEAKLREKLIEEGMVFTPITSETREALRQATAGIVEDLKKRVDPAVIDLVINEARAAK